MNKKEFIDEIRIEKEKAGKSNLRTIAAAIDRLQRAFPRYSSFIMEFIQNSDDAKSRNIKIVINSNKIRIFNDGNTFTNEDVESICDIGGSKKTPEDYIGYLGVGFKSIFLISDCPKIFSDGFNFKFDKSLYPKPKEEPWQILPHFISDDNIPIGDSQYRTIFDFDVKDYTLISKIKDEIRPEHLNERILLFLRSIERIHIVDEDDNYERIILKEPTTGKTKGYEVSALSHFINSELENKTNWVLFKSTYDVPEIVRQDFTTIEWDRENIKKREVMCVFRLNENNKIVGEEKGTAHIGVFSFLPLREVESGLKFLIHADFLTTPGRGELNRDCKWNEWLANKCYDLIKTCCIPVLESQEYWKFNYTDILTNNRGGHDLFKKHITDPLKEYFNENLKLVAEDGSTDYVINMIEIKNPIRSLFTDNDLKVLFSGKKVVHQECKYPQNQLLQTLTENLEDFLSDGILVQLCTIKAAENDFGWFLNLYKLIVETYSDDHFMSYTQHNVQHDNFWNKLKNHTTPLILCNNNLLGKISEVWTNKANIKIPSILKNKILIVTKEISNEDLFGKLLYKLNNDRWIYSNNEKRVISDITDDLVKSRIHLEELETLSNEKWESYSDDEKILKTQNLKSLFLEKHVKLDDFRNKITIKTKLGNWCNPEQIIFSSVYNPKHNFEKIVDSAFYDGNIEFLSDAYIRNREDYKEVEGWKKFFFDLGVDKQLNKEEDELRPIVERIAILSSLYYERNSGRLPRERDASAKKLGWDIDSTNRKIEVKGTSKPTGFELFLSTNEQKALFNNSDYFVYVVTNALNNPRIHAIIGKKLAEVKEDIKLTFPFRIWTDPELLENEYYIIKDINIEL